MRDMGVLLNVITIHSTGQHMFSDMLEAAGFVRHEKADIPEDGLLYSVWPYVEERYGTPEKFRAAITDRGRRYAEVMLVRHPVDIFLSRVERGSMHSDIRERSRLYQAEIDAFFSLVRKKEQETLKISYEDLCKGNVDPFRQLMKELGVPPDGIEKALAITHDGSMEKWLPDRRKTLRAEIRAINKVVRGDYSAHSAFSRHRHSRPAAIYLRLLTLWPPFYRNYRNLFLVEYTKRTGGKVTPPMKSLFRRLL